MPSDKHTPSPSGRQVTILGLGYPGIYCKRPDCARIQKSRRPERPMALSRALDMGFRACQQCHKKRTAPPAFSTRGPRVSPLQREVLAALAGGAEFTTRELAERLGRVNRHSFRVSLRALAGQGRVVQTVRSGVYNGLEGYVWRLGGGR